MADQFIQTYKQSFSLADMDPNMEFLNQFSGLNPSFHQHSHNNIVPQLSANMETNQLSANMETNFPGLFIHDDISVLPPFSDQPIILNDINDHKDRKRKTVETSTPESSCAYSSPQVSDSGSRKTNRGGKGKKAKCNEKESREVIHVRAKRGEATDSHSLAERVRRGKINERLRCLQDIVPGCYKSMGMALMLDEIINYVQSLQSQVEFLSMKLTAASTFHDFNSDTDAMEAMQRAKTLEALKVENVANQEGLPFALGFESLGLNFGHFS